MMVLFVVLVAIVEVIGKSLSNPEFLICTRVKFTLQVIC